MSKTLYPVQGTGNQYWTVRLIDVGVWRSRPFKPITVQRDGKARPTGVDIAISVLGKRAAALIRMDTNRLVDDIDLTRLLDASHNMFETNKGQKRELKLADDILIKPILAKDLTEVSTDLVVDFGNTATVCVAIPDTGRIDMPRLDRVRFLDRRYPRLALPDPRTAGGAAEDPQLRWHDMLRSCVAFEHFEEQDNDRPRAWVGAEAEALRHRHGLSDEVFVHSPKRALGLPLDTEEAPLYRDMSFGRVKRHPWLPAAVLLTEALIGAQEYINQVNDRPPKSRYVVSTIHYTAPITFRNVERENLRTAFQHACDWAAESVPKDLEGSKPAPASYLCDEASAVAYSYLFCEMMSRMEDTTEFPPPDIAFGKWVKEAKRAVSTAAIGDTSSPMVDAAGAVGAAESRAEEAEEAAGSGAGEAEEAATSDSLSVLVIDVGGCTTDLALVRFTFVDKEIRPTVEYVDGAVLGGDDYSEEIQRAVADEIKEKLDLQPKLIAEVLEDPHGDLQHALHRGFIREAERCKIAASRDDGHEVRLDEHLLGLGATTGVDLHMALAALSGRGSEGAATQERVQVIRGRFYDSRGHMAPVTLKADHVKERCCQMSNHARINRYLKTLIAERKPDICLLSGQSSRARLLEMPFEPVYIREIGQKAAERLPDYSANLFADLDKASVSLGAAVEYLGARRGLLKFRLKPKEDRIWPRVIYLKSHKEPIELSEVGSDYHEFEIAFPAKTVSVHLIGALGEDPSAPMVHIAEVVRVNPADEHPLAVKLKISRARPTELEVRKPYQEDVKIRPGGFDLIWI